MKLPEPRYIVTDKNHRYTIHAGNENYGPLDSVTKILGVINKPALVAWSAREAAKFFKEELFRLNPVGRLDSVLLGNIEKEAAMAHRKKSGAAMEIGTAVHALFQAILEGNEPPNIPPMLAEIVKEFKLWRSSTDIEIVAQEIAVGSIKEMFGGRFDAIGYSKSRGGFGVVDFKTSKGFFGNDYAYQVGGYGVAIEEQYGIDITWAEIARFSKEFPYNAEVRPVSDIFGAKMGFMEALALIRREKKSYIGQATYESAYKEPVRATESKTPLPF